MGSLTSAYDATGNRRQMNGPWARTGLPQPVASATYDAANQQLTFGARTLTYDPNGNLTNDGATTYTWNARYQLAALAAPQPASFVYDGLNRRLRKTLDGVTTDFLYDGLNPVQERTGTAVADLLTGLYWGEERRSGREGGRAENGRSVNWAFVGLMLRMHR